MHAPFFVLFLFSPVLFFAVFAAVDLFLRVGQNEDVIQFLLDGSDAAGVAASGHILDFLWQGQPFFLYDAVVLYDIDGDVVIDEAQSVQIDGVDGTLDLDDIFLAHLVAPGVFDDGHAAVEFIQIQILIDLHASACFNMIQHKAFTESSDI